MTNWWYFSYFSDKSRLDISCKLSSTVKTCFLRKIRKIFQKVICWSFLSQHTKLQLYYYFPLYCKNLFHNYILSNKKFSTDFIFMLMSRMNLSAANILLLSVPHVHMIMHQFVYMRLTNCYKTYCYTTAIKLRKKTPSKHCQALDQCNLVLRMLEFGWLPQPQPQHVEYENMKICANGAAWLEHWYGINMIIKWS